MKYKLLYTSKAKKDLSNFNSKIASKILDKIDFYFEEGNPIKYSKKLSNFKNGTYRFKIGDYRAIFDVDNKGNITILIILRIKHRKEVFDSNFICGKGGTMLECIY